MNFKHKEKGDTGTFYLQEDKSGEHQAEIVYSREQPDRIVIQHTEVTPQLRGRNLGNLLVQAVVEFARSNNIKVVPLCVFASSVFRRHKEYADVLA